MKIKMKQPFMADGFDYSLAIVIIVGITLITAYLWR